MRVAIFLDGRPGHEKQTLGIVSALSDYTEITEKEIIVPPNSFKRQVTDYWNYFIGRSEKYCHELAGYDLYIGTGTATHLPMLMCKRRHNVPIVTCMTPSPILVKKFDLCFVPRHDGVQERNNFFFTIGPPNLSKSGDKHQDNNSLILIGGVDQKSHHWNTAEVETQLEKLVANDDKMQWTISTSPRTPQDTTERIENLSENNPNIHFFRFEETPKGWIEKEYSRNKTVWVTADSMSMVYEALSSGCNVGILPVHWKKKTSKFIRSENYLLDKKIVVSLDDWLAKRSHWSLREPLNEAKKCAEEILRRWKKKSLQ